MGLQEGADLENTSYISQLLKLPQREVHASRIVHEPLVDYYLSQVLTFHDHIQNMEEIATKKSIVAKQKEEKARQLELTRAWRAVDKALKESAKRTRAVDKEKREQTLKKWKQNDNGGQREKILQLVLQNGPYDRKNLHISNPIPWQNKVNQRIARAKLIAKKKKKECEVLLPKFPPLLELPWFYGCTPARVVHPEMYAEIW